MQKAKTNHNVYILGEILFFEYRIQNTENKMKKQKIKLNRRRKKEMNYIHY